MNRQPEAEHAVSTELGCGPIEQQSPEFSPAHQTRFSSGSDYVAYRVNVTLLSWFPQPLLGG